MSMDDSNVLAATARRRHGKQSDKIIGIAPSSTLCRSASNREAASRNKRGGRNNSEPIPVLQAITDNIPSVIYRVSLRGGQHDIRVSPQLLELGISAKKWGNDAELHHQMCHEEDRSIVKEALAHSYQNGSVFQCEYRINTFCDTLRWFQDKAKIVTDKYGRPAFLQGVMVDITATKMMEAELARYRYMHDKMVRDRTEMLNRRIAILESCNSSLCENYHSMHQMYLDLLSKTQTHGNTPAACVNV